MIPNKISRRVKNHLSWLLFFGEEALLLTALFHFWRCTEDLSLVVGAPLKKKKKQRWSCSRKLFFYATYGGFFFYEYSSFAVEEEPLLCCEVLSSSFTKMQPQRNFWALCVPLLFFFAVDSRALSEARRLHPMDVAAAAVFQDVLENNDLLEQVGVCILKLMTF